MALSPNITEQQVKAKEPVDQQLMEAIRENLLRIDNQTLLAGATDFSFKVNGELDILELGSNPDAGKAIDAAFVAQARTLQLASLYIDDRGATGTLEVDVRRLKFLGLPISGIENIFTANTQSVARGSAALSTQSITKAEADISTQSISYAKAAINIDNIVQTVGTNLWRYNFDVLEDIDEDFAIGKFVEFSGCDNAANNGVFQIVDVNRDGGKNIVVTNAAGVAQASPNGSMQLLLVQYVYAAAVPPNFNPGENIVFSGHGDVSNDGTFEIYKTNVGANNVVVYRTTALIEQVIVGGQAAVLRYQYNFLAPAPSAFVEGELAVFAGHTDVANDGSLEVKVVNNNLGNNLVVYNPSGALQAAPAGTIDTNRWVYALDQNPDGFIEIGDNVIFSGHTDVANDGTFPIVDVRYLATDNVVIYNASGVAQAAAAGTSDAAQKAITFREDFSSFFTAGSSVVEITETLNNNGTFTVLDVNRTAVSPYNIVCELTSGILQEGDNGQVFSEIQSIFTAGSLTMDVVKDKQILTVTNIGGEILDDELAADTILLFDILQTPAGASTVAINVK